MKTKIIFSTLGLLLFTGCYKKPTASFSWSPENPRAGDLVTFYNSSTFGKQYEWNLGNTKVSSEAEPVTVYNTAGDYIVDLKVYNGTKTDKTTQTITVVP